MVDTKLNSELATNLSYELEALNILGGKSIILATTNACIYLLQGTTSAFTITVKDCTPL